MLRSKITIPESSLLVHIDEIPVFVGHINYGNHLGHDSLVSILHEARMRFIKHHGIIDEARIVENIGFVIVDLSVNYLAETFYGEKLTVKIFVSEIQKKACVFHYRVTKLIKEVEQIVALAKTTQLFMDFKTKRPVAIPHNFLEIMQTSR